MQGRGCHTQKPAGVDMGGVPLQIDVRGAVRRPEHLVYVYIYIHYIYIYYHFIYIYIHIYIYICVFFLLFFWWSSGGGRGSQGKGPSAEANPTATRDGGRVGYRRAITGTPVTGWGAHRAPPAEGWEGREGKHHYATTHNRHTRSMKHPHKREGPRGA